MLSHRELIETLRETPVVIDCSWYNDSDLLQPWHPYTQDSQASLSPGQIHEIDIEMNATFLEFKKEHRLPFPSRPETHLHHYPPPQAKSPLSAESTQFIQERIPLPECCFSGNGLFPRFSVISCRPRC